MSAPPVVQAVTRTVGSHGIDNVASVADGLSYEVTVRTASAGVFVGGSELNNQQGLGGSGNPMGAGFELVVNREYKFTLVPNTQLLAATDVYTLFIYNSNAASISYSALVIAK